MAIIISLIFNICIINIYLNKIYIYLYFFYPYHSFISIIIIIVKIAVNRNEKNNIILQMHY